MRLWEVGLDQSLRLMDTTVFERLVWELAEIDLFSFCPLLWSEYLCSPKIHLLKSNPQGSGVGR